jgi:hypothetical protein
VALGPLHLVNPGSKPHKPIVFLILNELLKWVGLLGL